MIDSITLLRAKEAGLPAAESHPDPPLHCFPLRMDWEIATGYRGEVQAYPVPQVNGYLVAIDQWPAVVAKLYGTASCHGWSATVTRAVGTMPHAAYGTPTAEHESFAIRLTRGAQRAVGVYRAGHWESMWLWSADQFFARRGTLEEFMTAVTGPFCNKPSGAEWSKMLVKYPLRPTKKEWEAMRGV